MDRLRKFNRKYIDLKRVPKSDHIWYDDGYGCEWNGPVLEVTLKSWVNRRTEEPWWYQMVLRLDESDRITSIMRMKQNEGDDYDLKRFPEPLERKAEALLKKIVITPEERPFASVQPVDVNLIGPIVKMVQMAASRRSGIVRVGSLIVCADGREQTVNLLAPVTHQFIILWYGSGWSNDGWYDVDSLKLQWSGKYTFVKGRGGKMSVLTRWYFKSLRAPLFARDPQGILKKLATMERQILRDCRRKKA